MSLPIPDVQYGKADWRDFIDNWREADAEWLQARTILRFQTTASRDAALGGALPGQFVFNVETGILEIKGASSWLPYKPMPVFTVKTQDDAAQVSISHINAGGKGVNLTPTSVTVNADFSVLTSILTVAASGVRVKTGAKTALLTTDAASLVSDSPISAPSLSLTGAGTVLSAPGKTVSTGSIVADSGAITNISMTGTLTGGILNGTSGTIGGVSFASNIASTSGGYVSQNGYFYGDGSTARLRRRNPAGGAVGTAFMSVSQDDVRIITTGESDVTPSLPGSIFMQGVTRFMGGRPVPWHNAAGTHVAYCGPTIYSPTDPGVANFPDGTIWIS